MYEYRDDAWQQHFGKLSWLSHNSNGEFWGVDSYGDIYTKAGSQSTQKKFYINGDGIDNLVAYTLQENSQSEQTYYYHTDHLGSVRAISDEEGELVSRYDYSAFGIPRLIGENGETEYSVSDMRGYTGREYESNIGLYYYRGRYYSPHLGRFLSRDPIDVSDDVNLYRYVGNSPMSFI